MENQEKVDKWSCEIAGLLYDKYMIQSYGITNCNINYTEGDLVEKIIRRSILNFGTVCETLPRCHKRESLTLDTLLFPIKLGTFPVPLPPNPTGTNQTVVKRAPILNVAYQYLQSYPLQVWTINHNLSFHPNVSIADINGNQIEGAIQYLNQTSYGGTIQITFSEPVSGSAYLS